jgi:hypothetical protein
MDADRAMNKVKRLLWRAVEPAIRAVYVEILRQKGHQDAGTPVPSDSEG